MFETSGSSILDSGTVTGNIIGSLDAPALYFLCASCSGGKIRSVALSANKVSAGAGGTGAYFDSSQLIDVSFIGNNFTDSSNYLSSYSSAPIVVIGNTPNTITNQF